MEEIICSYVSGCATKVAYDIKNEVSIALHFVYSYGGNEVEVQ